MSLFGRKERQEIQRLMSQVLELQGQLTPEQQEIESLRGKISELEKSKTEITLDIATMKAYAKELSKEIANKKHDLIQMDEEILLQSFGLYRPNYDFTSAEEYRIRLDKIRAEQKALIKSDKAVTGYTGWTINGNAAQGKKMVKDMQKLLLRAFNSECDEVVDKVKYNNFDSGSKRISASYEAITKLGVVMGVSIAPAYYRLKTDELRLAFEYRQKKQQEKEEQKEIRAQLREEAKLQREIEERRKFLEKEKNHYNNALDKILMRIEKSAESENRELLEKKKEIESSLLGVETALKDVDYRQANQRAGYVYIASNIGAFGEDVFKIGMTRRLDPMERIYELGDASVPFNFDVHAMIFSDDAPALEAALHKAFDDRKLNWVNLRREFFSVTLDEIKTVVRKNYDKTVEFVEAADAEQYRTSLLMKQTGQGR